MAANAQRITFSSGITATVRPPRRARALILAAKTAPYHTRPGEPRTVAFSRYLKLAALVAPYVDCAVPVGADKAAHLALTVLAAPDDWEQLAKAVFVSLLGSKVSR